MNKKLSERRGGVTKKIILPNKNEDEIIPMENLRHGSLPTSCSSSPEESPSLSRRRPRTVLQLPSQMSTPLTPAVLTPSWMKTQKFARSRRNTGNATEMGASSGFLTMRKPGTRFSHDRYAEEIADAFEQDEVLMDNSPESEQLRLETLRELTEALGLKRNVKERISRTVSLNSEKAPPGASKRFRYRVRAALTKMRKGARETVSGLEIWYNTIKDIEGKFGSGVATYFRFLRTMILLNSFVLVISFGFLVTPQLLDRYYVVITNETYWHVAPNPDPYPNNTEFTFGNLITGEGWLANTELFYGAYSNESVALSEDHEYNIPCAYFFTTFFCYFITLIILSVSLARSYRQNFIEMQGGLMNVYAQKIFCGWDFSVVDPEAAQLRSQSIYNELRELLHEDAQNERATSSKLQRVSLIAVRAGVTLLVATLLIGSGVLVWFLLKKQEYMGNVSDESQRKAAMMMSLIVTCVMLILPMIFSRLAALERYANPRNAVYATLLRIFGLEVAIIGVLLAFWLGEAPTSSCWETSLGQEVYRLILVDLLICLFFASIAEFARARLHRTIWPGIGAPQFDIARNTLNLIYNQTLFWVGFYFSPLLSIVIVLKLLMTFYIKKLCVLYNCQPSPRSWRAAQTQTVFLAITFLAIVGVIVTLGYVFTQVETSNDCGPFKNNTYMYETLQNVFNVDDSSALWGLINFFTMPGVVAFIIIALCVLVYYMRAVSRARGAMVDLLKGMLVLEAEDKIFLQQSISEAAKGGWVPHRSPLRSLRLSAPRTNLKKSTL